MKKLKIKFDSSPPFSDRSASNEFEHSICRFCLKTFRLKDKKILICQEIRKQFSSLTNSELKESRAFSELICRTCKLKLSETSSFKEVLLKNQEKLNETSDVLEDRKNSMIIINIENERNVSETEKIDESSIITEILNNVDFENLELGEPRIESLELFENSSEIHDSVVPENNSKTQKLNSLTKTPGKLQRANPYRNKTKDLIERTYCCDLCGNEYGGKKGLSIHMRNHRMNQEPVESLTCNFPDCSQIFKNKRALRHHRDKIHLRKNEINCHLCGKIFSESGKNKFEAHLLKHSGARPFACSIPGCGKFFHSQEMKNRHEKYAHEEPKRCQICGGTYANTVVLQKHLKIHQELKFKCDYEGCTKQFVEKTRLNEHKKTHFGQKDFVCRYPGCRKEFYKKRSLVKHVSSVHMQLKIPCEVPGCTSKLTSKCTYRAHVLGYHQNFHPDYVDQILKGIRLMKIPKPDLLDQ